MKIQIDLKARTIKIDEDLTLKQLLKVVKELRPNDWAEYTLQVNTVINNWYNPIRVSWPWTYTTGGNIGINHTLTSSNNTVYIKSEDVPQNNNLSINPGSLLNYEIKA